LRRCVVGVIPANAEIQLSVLVNSGEGRNPFDVGGEDQNGSRPSPG
jgi:hypothetical protein